MRKVLKTAKSKNGNLIELVTNGEISDNNVLIIGVFHGDEPQGKCLIERYLEDAPPRNRRFRSPHRGGDMPYVDRQQIIKFAQYMRNNSTEPEIILWQYLKNRQMGVKFRRQAPIGNYIVDFVSYDVKLIIELDGGQHNESEQISSDEKRTDDLKNCGFRVLRFWNNEVQSNLNDVLNCIKYYVDNDKEDLMSPFDRGTEIFDFEGDVNALIFIPCLNPDGMAQNTRTNANGVDLNRNFPTKNWGEDGSAAGEDASSYFGGTAPASEVETRFVIDVIEEYKPKLILTLHAPYKVVNYDGPAKEIAEEISEIIKYPVEASIGYPTPGSFGTYCGGERSIPTITLELDEEIPVEELIEPVHNIFDILI